MRNGPPCWCSSVLGLRFTKNDTLLKDGKGRKLRAGWRGERNVERDQFGSCTGGIENGWALKVSFKRPGPKFSTAGLGDSDSKRGSWTRVAGTVEAVFAQYLPAG